LYHSTLGSRVTKQKKKKKKKKKKLKGFRFWVEGFGCGVWGSGFRVSGVGIHDLGFEFRV